MPKSGGAISWSSNVAPAAWVRAGLHPFRQDLGSLVPEGYEAYGRLFHPIETGGVRQKWAEVARRNRRLAHANMQYRWISRPAGAGQLPPADGIVLGPSEGSLPLAERRVLVEFLRSATTTPDRCWFCVWEGWGGLDAGEVATRVELPQRSYLFYGGPVETALECLPSTGKSISRAINPRITDEGASTEALALDNSPNLWWPDDRAWFVATEIDHPWTYVASSRRVVDQLMAEPRLEMFPVQPTDNPFADGDALNAALDRP
jgi:hypothetical protein